VVADVTSVNDAERPSSVEDALELVRIEWDRVRRPDDQAPPVEIEDPRDAQTADMIGGRFLVAGRRGQGSSGVALAVLDDETGDDRELILKVARDDAAGRRLEAEAEVLSGLEHPRIVRYVETLELGGRRALLMSDAGKETLATRLVKEGQSTLEQLQRWGTDLLEAMAYLVDVKGVFHRTLSPQTLASRRTPSTGSLT
jgi:serine/threonine protein kinase